MSKFKVGDLVIRTEAVEYFRYGTEPVTITWINEDGDLYFKNEENNPTNGGWLADYFALCVKPENKVPNNMEFICYQAYPPDGWVMVDRDSYELSRMAGWSTRILYAFKQD